MFSFDKFSSGEMKSQIRKKILTFKGNTCRMQDKTVHKLQKNDK